MSAPVDDPTLDARRQAFDAHRELLGISAAAHVSCTMVAPSRVSGLIDVGSVTSLLGVRRDWPGAAWPVLRLHNWGGTPADARDPGATLIPAQASPVPLVGGASPLMPALSSPGVTLSAAGAGPGRQMYLLDPAAGLSGPVDVVCGWLFLATGPMDGEHANDRAEHGPHVRLPVQRLSVDLLVHRDLDFAHPVRARVLMRTPDAPPTPDGGVSGVALDVPTHVEELGAATPEAPVPEMTQYARVVGELAGRMGQQPEAFRVYRYRLDRPPLGSVVVVSHPLRWPPLGR